MNIKVAYRCGHVETLRDPRHADHYRAKARHEDCLACRYARAVHDPTVTPFSYGNRTLVVRAHDIRRRQMRQLGETIIKARLHGDDGVADVLWNARRCLSHQSDPLKVIAMRDAWDEIAERYKETLQ